MFSATARISQTAFSNAAAAENVSRGGALRAFREPANALPTARRESPESINRTMPNGLGRCIGGTSRRRKFPKNERRSESCRKSDRKSRDHPVEEKTRDDYSVNRRPSATSAMAPIAIIGRSGDRPNARRSVIGVIIVIEMFYDVNGLFPLGQGEAAAAAAAGSGPTQIQILSILNNHRVFFVGSRM